MRRSLLLLACSALALAGCRNNPADLTAKNPQWVPTPVPPIFAANFFETFDAAVSPTGGWTYGDTGSSVALSILPAAAHSGSGGLRAVITAAGWGAGFGFDSRLGARNFSGATQMKAWVYSNAAISGGNNFQLLFNESGSGANAEVWQSPGQSIAAGAWTEFVLPLSGFSEDPYGNAACQPNCNQPGNGDNAMQLGAVKSVQFKVNGAAGSMTVDLDDIRFE